MSSTNPSKHRPGLSLRPAAIALATAAALTLAGPAAADTHSASSAPQESTADAVEALRQRLDAAEAAREAQAAELETLRAALEQARADADAAMRELARIQAATREAESALAAHEAETRAARSAASEAEVERDALTAELAAANEALAAARARLAPGEGGTASAEAARTAAAQAAEHYLALRQRLRRNPTPEQRRQLDEAAAAVADAQLLAARLSGAHGLYRVRPNDTLAIIAARFYGDGAHWPRIHEANRHVLPDPDRVEAGLTLIMPAK